METSLSNLFPAHVMERAKWYECYLVGSGMPRGALTPFISLRYLLGWFRCDLMFTDSDDFKDTEIEFVAYSEINPRQERAKYELARVRIKLSLNIEEIGEEGG